MQENSVVTGNKLTQTVTEYLASKGYHSPVIISARLEAEVFLLKFHFPIFSCFLYRLYMEDCCIGRRPTEEGGNLQVIWTSRERTKRINSEIM